jgi:small-conductance mechanosensitive channel
MKGGQKAILGALLLLVLASLGAYIFTQHWAISPGQLSVNRKGVKRADLVDTRALTTAQQVAQLAITPEEQDYAREVLRLADLSVDLAFDSALRQAAENPPPLTPETRGLAARMKDAQDDVSADEDRIAQLTDKVAKARGSKKDALQGELDMAKAQLSLDKDELDDAHEDLIRAGGDRKAVIQQQLDRHEASGQHDAAPASWGSVQSSPELTQSESVLAELRAWASLHTKEKLLRQAQQNLQERIAKLTGEHNELESQVNAKKARHNIKIRKGAAPGANGAAGRAAPGTAAAPAQAPAPPRSATTPSAPSPPAAPAAGQANPPMESQDAASRISVLQTLRNDQKTLGEYDKCIETEQELGGVYANWIALVNARERSFLHGLFRSAFYIFLIALLVFIANFAVHIFFLNVSPERRDLHTMRAATLLGLQVVGVLLILLVVFGPPGNLGTILGLAGAGLTVALKDFILGFIGWFVLMGKDGIRPGDWVEINGVGGEVVEVGPLHTILLETGNWLDAAHPTGRKVSFVNSFAIEGHYFNFSTSGQWLWDELQVQVPERADPYPLLDAIKKIVTDETAANARLAEAEWERVTPAYARGKFTADPSIAVRPSAIGLVIYVRYITRANERQEVRARLYQAVVELMHKRNIPEAAPVQPSSRTV